MPRKGHIQKRDVLADPLYDNKVVTKLINQMEDQCSDGFLDVCNLQAGDGSLAAYYAVPYISQALVLMYNKADFTGQEEKLQSFEGLLEVAQQKNKLAVSYAGGDGYNFSNFLLAQPYSADAKEAFGNLGSLLIYSKGIQTNNYNYGIFLCILFVFWVCVQIHKRSFCHGYAQEILPLFLPEEGGYQRAHR